MKLPPALQARWALLATREKSLVAAAVTLVALALVWWIGLSPALRTLRAADAQHRALDTQLQQMRALQLQAEAMKAQPRQNQDEALRALETAVRQQLALTARLSVQGDRATVTLTGTPPEALTQWLTQSRVNARALPTEARLVRNAAGMWDGTVVLTLPARQP